ncbi:hypothetical protein [Nocardioides alcanivorans]|uniref:hypothetical protein n=1 Tax=Nocardioides alcanivorans TaxID=2897352 RepID=UPI001F3AE4A3|nr:hypothetical protein [Nocardioides alcanivorans]
MSTPTIIVFVAVVAGRFLLPLLIFRYPLPAIIGCLVLDGYDQSIFQWFGYDPEGYQSYDKAMDVFYLAIAYIATLRNWTSMWAFRVGWFLYFYRLAGVVLFEVTQLRPLLLIFPNAFEYFFIAYEAIRTRWRVVGRSYRFWVALAAIIWIFVKLPQEYWIHVAKMDMSDTLRDHPWTIGALLVLILVAAGVITLLARRFLGGPDHPLKLRADPVPEEMNEARERAAWTARHAKVRSLATLEKIVLVGLVAVIYGHVLPDFTGSSFQLFVGIGIVVAVNAFYTIVASRRMWTVESAWAGFIGRLAFNVVFAFGADWLLNRGSGNLDLIDTFFFLSLISLMTSLHDRYRPVHAVRKRLVPEEASRRELAKHARV